jgi:hypothetical protein
MPTKRLKRPRDPIQPAKLMGHIATGEKPKTDPLPLD